MREFPILFGSTSRVRGELERLGCPRSIPWDWVEPHEAQAIRNHDQTLERLAQRGGLSPAELLAVVTGRGYRFIVQLPLTDSVRMLLEWIEGRGECRRLQR